VDRLKPLEPDDGFPKAKLADGASPVKVGQIIEYRVDNITMQSTAFEHIGLPLGNRGAGPRQAALNPALPFAERHSFTAAKIPAGVCTMPLGG